MEIVGSVDPNDIPKAARRISSSTGIWTGLAKQAAADYDQGKVTVVKVKDFAEYKKMRNGTSQAFREMGFRVTCRVIESRGEVTVYFQLEEKPDGAAPSVSTRRRNGGASASKTVDNNRRR